MTDLLARVAALAAEALKNSKTEREEEKQEREKRWAEIQRYMPRLAADMRELRRVFGLGQYKLTTWRIKADGRQPETTTAQVPGGADQG